MLCSIFFTINVRIVTYFVYYNWFITIGLFCLLQLKEFDARLLKVDKKDYNVIDIYYIGYVTIKKIANCHNINSKNTLYLMINEMIGQFEEKSEKSV